MKYVAFGTRRSTSEYLSIRSIVSTLLKLTALLGLAVIVAAWFGYYEPLEFIIVGK